MSGEARKYSVLFALTYGSVGAAGITGQALNSLMKDRLALGPADAAVFMAVASIPAYFAPLYALLSDTVPLFGSRRKSYLALAGLLGASSWTLLGAPWAGIYSVSLTFLAMSLLALQMSNVVANALMVESGKPTGMTGAFQAVQWGAANVAALITTFCSGYVVERFSGALAFRLYAVFPFLVTVGALVLLSERRDKGEAASRSAVWPSVRAMLVSRKQWAVTLFLALWFFSPGLGTALYYFQRDRLGFGPGYIGTLGAVFAGAGIAAGAVYAPLSRRLPALTLIRCAVVAGTAGHLGYLAMFDRVSAAAIYLVDGGLSMFAMLAVLDLGARVAPEHVEGTAFSMLTTARIAASLAGGVIGARLYEAVGLRALILISAVFTACCGFVIPWLFGSARVPSMPVVASTTGGVQ